MLRGECEAAMAACRKSLELATDPIARVHGLGWLGAAHFECGNPTEAIPLLEQALDQLRRLSRTGAPRQLDLWLSMTLGEAYLAKNDLDGARELTSSALALSLAGGWPGTRGYAECAVARVALADGKLDEAEALVRQALDTFVTVDVRNPIGRAHLLLAEILAARGDPAAAVVELEAAREAFTQMGAPRLVERTAQLAVTLGLERG
jgi:tetratricopeptide (TPR) repeat protein